MAISGRDDASDIRKLARRIHQRWLEYRRRNPGRSVPIDDTLSRILEHDPEYRPPRRRTASGDRPPLRNPGIFTIDAIAKSLQTTVGDLLGERGYIAARDALTLAERRKLREAMTLLRERFDLDDLALAGDFDPPEPLHVWVVPEGAAITTLERVREVSDARLRLLRLRSDAMAPELANGATIILDIERVAPETGDVVAVQTKHEGAVLGRWQLVDGKPSIVRRNPAYPPVLLEGREWTVLGTVTSAVETTSDS